MKIEVVVTIWDDGLFKLRDKTEANDFCELETNTRHLLENVEKKYEEQQVKKYAVAEDDDIPF